MKGDVAKKGGFVEKYAVAKGRSIHCSPRKANLVAGLLRGKTALEGLLLLVNSQKRVADDFAKLIKSAMSNASANHGMDVSRLYIATVEVGKDLVLKRLSPRARGRGNRILKRFCKISVFLTEVN